MGSQDWADNSNLVVLKSLIYPDYECQSVLFLPDHKISCYTQGKFSLAPQALVSTTATQGLFDCLKYERPTDFYPKTALIIEMVRPHLAAKAVESRMLRGEGHQAPMLVQPQGQSSPRCVLTSLSSEGMEEKRRRWEDA